MNHLPCRLTFTTWLKPRDDEDSYTVKASVSVMKLPLMIPEVLLSSMADIFLQKYENYHKTVEIFHKLHLFIEVRDSQGNGELVPIKTAATGGIYITNALLVAALYSTRTLHSPRESHNFQNEPKRIIRNTKKVRYFAA